MGIDWKRELKKFIAKRIKELYGEEVSPDQIQAIEFNEELDYSSMTLRDLANLYAFAIMKEEFEEAEIIAKEINNHNAEIKINIDDTNKTANIDVIQHKAVDDVISISMIVKPDGLMIDFEKELN